MILTFKDMHVCIFSYKTDPKSKPTTSSGAQPKTQEPVPMLEARQTVLNQLMVSSGAPAGGLFQGNYL